MINIKDINLKKVFKQADQFYYVYKGAIEIWPGNAVDNTGFLKYYESNIPQKFGFGENVNPNAAYDQGLSLFASDFPGPDTAPVFKTQWDEYLSYKSNNIADKFKANPIVGIYDQDLLYDISNIQTEFIDINPAVDENAPYDQGLSLFASDFPGPDTAPIFNINYAEYQKFDSSNIPQQFKNPPDTGIFDQYVVYSSSNIPAEFPA